MEHEAVAMKRIEGLRAVSAPAALVVGGVALLQWHSIRFWSAQVGATGWAWSVLLEGVALRAQLAALYAAPREAASHLGTVRRAVIAMQAIALLLFQVTNVMALRSLAERQARACEREALGGAVPALGPPACEAPAPVPAPDTALPEPSARLAAVLKAWRR